MACATRPPSVRLGTRLYNTKATSWTGVNKLLSKEKVKVIMDLALPWMVTELQCFLGSIDYYQSKIPWCNIIDLPMLISPEWQPCQKKAYPLER